MVDVTITGLDEAIKKLESLKMSLSDLLKKVCERLMDEGFNVAQARFDEGSKLYEGTSDVKVATPVWEDDLLVLRANGNAVAFIEFGTSTSTEPYPSDFPGNPDPYGTLHLDGRGEYGKKHGANPPWYYPLENGGTPKKDKNGKESTKWAVAFGNPPARAMYQAAITVSDKEKARKIALEVLGK